ncbi:hypothetical protein EVAR_42911_1 [Eumeta japonica]|uniref:Uncharacterized protein n=1 Tax=Eumeta variegata TaxID=151549 RepID=A0A4C1WTT8_EUMVA|nr:hypothetical protein EVAR_42911_1 [Eumeta japonica]
MRTNKPKQASAFAKLRLLTWKNFLQQWRHRGQTSAEVGLPVLTMSLILILRWQISPEYRDTFLYPPVSASTLNHSTSILLTAFACSKTCTRSASIVFQLLVLGDVIIQRQPPDLSGGKPGHLTRAAVLEGVKIII